jgi:hypothetical protein
MQTFFTKTLMYDHMDQNIEENILFSQDRVINSGKKKFGFCPLKSIDKFTNYLKTNQNIYEILPSDTPIKPYFDLEMIGNYTDEDCKCNLNLFLASVRNFIHEKMDINLLKKDFIILDSCRPGKLSYHVIIQNKIYFKSISDHKRFIQELEQHYNCPRNDLDKDVFKRLSYTYKDSDRFIFDCIPYGNDQNVRCINQSKLGSNFCLINKNTDYTIEDSLIRLYNSIGDRIPVSTIKKENKHIIHEVITGIDINEQKQKILDLLNRLLPSRADNYEDWRNIGFIIKHELGQSGFLIFNNFSMSSKSYKSTDVFNFWTSISKSSRNPMTIATLYKMANNDNYFNYNADLMIKFKLSKYYNENFVIKDTLEQELILISKVSHTCLLCECKHKINEIKLTVTNVNNYNLCCHNKNHIYYKPPKGRDKTDDEKKKTRDTILNDFFHITYPDNFNIVNEDSKYISCDKENKFIWKPIYDNNKYIMIDAQMGKGKSTFIKNFLKHDRKTHKKQKILFISQRKTFTHFICGEFQEFNIQNYMDMKNATDYEKAINLCIQLESLLKTTIEYDIIILDEIESILNQFSSSTLKRCQDTFSVFQHLISNARIVLSADAFILQRSIDFLYQMSTLESKTKDKNILLIKNNKSYLDGRKAVQISQDKYNDSVIKSLNDGKKVFAISTTKCDLRNLESNIIEQTKDKNIKVYDCDSDKTDLRNVNEAWKNADLVLNSPTTTIGLSYTAKPSFDVAYGYLKSTNLARDAMQMLLRVRVLNDDTLYFSLNNKQFCDVNKVQLFNCFNDFTNINNDKIKSIVQKLKENDKCPQNMICAIEITLNKVDPILQHILYHNAREYIISKIYYNHMVIKMLKMQNYDVSLLKKEDNHQHKPEENNDEFYERYNEIEDINADMAKQLSNDLQTKENRDNKTKVDKFFFNNLFNEDTPEHIKAKLFFNYYLISNKKHILYNIQLEKSNLSFEQLLDRDMIVNDNIISNMSLNSLKLQHITNFNKIIGLKHSQDQDIIIEKSIIINECKEYIKENLKQLCIVFESNISISDDETKNNSMVIKLINKIYNNWSCNKLKVNNKTGKITLNYKLNGLKDFYQYIKPLRKKQVFEQTAIQMMIEDED